MSKSSQSFLTIAFGSFIIVKKRSLVYKTFWVWLKIFSRIVFIDEKSRGPRIEPCGTPALMKPRDKHWSFSKTRCILLSRKLINNCNQLQQIPFPRNLWISPSCHTLLDALDISKNASYFWPIIIAFNISWVICN